MDFNRVEALRCLRFSFTVPKEGQPQLEGHPAPRHAREFVALCAPVALGRPEDGWVAHVEEVGYEERGGPESGPLGLDQHRWHFGTLFLGPIPDALQDDATVRVALDKAMCIALYEELVSDPHEELMVDRTEG